MLSKKLLSMFNRSSRYREVGRFSNFSIYEQGLQHSLCFVYAQMLPGSVFKFIFFCYKIRAFETFFCLSYHINTGISVNRPNKHMSLVFLSYTFVISLILNL